MDRVNFEELRRMTAKFEGREWGYYDCPNTDLHAADLVNRDFAYTLLDAREMQFIQSREVYAYAAFCMNAVPGLLRELEAKEHSLKICKECCFQLQEAAKELARKCK